MKQRKELNRQVGERIKLARERAGLTQEQFAEDIGRTPQFISDLERGVTGASLETLKLTCGALHVSCDSLLLGAGPQNDVERLSQKLAALPPHQFAALETIINTFLSAVRA